MLHRFFSLRLRHSLRISLLAGALLAGTAQTTGAEELAIGNYGVSANGMPFGVALAKGYFKDEGLNITGLISSAGGGTSLRDMLPGGGVPYGGVNPGGSVSPLPAGAPPPITSDHVPTVGPVRRGGKPG